ncbi:methylmalonyl-CoA mutase [SAR202 cluster bacterium AD-804-J14_MRT_500m]|nr:methylmalonyl-CoA mutase [SAR202 cluster bacterium AD-804-J14_MRT_500m]
MESSPERKSLFKTPSGIEIDRVYEQAYSDGNEQSRDVGLPGEFPFVRGVHATGYRGRLWTMRMFAGYGTAEETNARFKYLLDQGQTGLSVAFDMPTLYGYDTDDKAAAGEFGRCGTAVSSLADMEALFDGIPLDQITTSMTINSPAAIIWAMYIALAQKRGLPLETLGGTIQNDILKEYSAQNEYIFPPGPSMRLVTDTVEFASGQLPKWNPISISGYHIREAGSTAVQELAFTLADGFEYVDWCLDRGLSIDSFAPRLSFFFNVHNDFFEEIAKFRAARKLWAEAMRDKYGAKNPRSWWMRFHAQTAGFTLTAQQPENNITRVALQAMAAVLGGCQSLHTNSMDEAWALPSEKAALIALRTQQVIAEEMGVTGTVDPLGGSFYLETLTRQVADGAQVYFDRIEDIGGVIPAIESGFLQREIAESAYVYQQEMDRHDRVMVGVNAYESLGEQLEIPLLKVDMEGEHRQISRLNDVRRTRDNRQVKSRLRDLETAARGTDNLMPYILDAVQSYATLGEMMGVFREVFGEYKPTWLL